MDPQTIPPQSLPTQPVTQVPPSPPVKSKNNLFTIVLIILFLLVLGAAGLFLYQNYQLKQQLSQIQPTPTSPITPIPTVDPTSNWKTYTNPYNQFSFKYPSNYLLTTDVRNYLNNNITWGSFNDSVLNCSGDCPIVNHTEKTSLGGKPATKITGYIGSIGGNIPQSYITYEVVLGTKYFIISMQALPFVMTKDEAAKYDSNTTQQIKPEDQTIFDQILSTFTFVDQTTYQNPTLGFTLTFPSSWVNKYSVVEESNAVHFLYTDNANSKAELFTLYVMSPQEWQAAQSGPHSIFISENTNTRKVYSYSLALSAPFENSNDPRAQDFTKMIGDVKNIISTFQFTN